MGRRPEDRFANQAAVQVTESAAGTMTFAELLTGISIGQGVGILVDQIDYFVAAGALEDVIAAGDFIECGWFVTNTMSGFDPVDRRQIHQMTFSQILVGAVVSQTHILGPFSYQFFPPIIFAGPRMYFGVLGTSLAAPVTATSRMLFRYISLSDKEYLEIAESFILVG